MTYFGFLLRFLVIPILVFLAITWWDNRTNKPTRGFANGRAVWTAILVHVIIAVTYTTPWDNYLVATGVWYYNPELVTGIVLGYVPIEEYTFFVLETILAGLWWWFLARRIPEPTEPFKPSVNVRLTAFGILAAAWMVFTYLLFFGGREWTYLAIIFFWALPPIFPQMLYGADILWHHRRLVLAGILVPGTFLSLTDIVALTDTTWSIAKDQTTGILFFDILPIEEAAFFFITVTLINFGMTLLLSNIGRRRFADWKARGYKGLP